MIENPPQRATNPHEAKTLHDAERSNVPFVHWRNDEDDLCILMLPAEHERVTIGRRSDCDLPLSWDPEVSRTHALLESVGGHWTLVDDDLSRNGSFVNGSRIRSRRRLRNRDRMCFGNTHVTYCEPPEDSDSTKKTIDDPASGTLSVTQRKVLIALCRPLADSTSATPATNQQIADEVLLSVDAVKAHLRLLFERFGLDELPQNEKRAQLAAKVLEAGLLAPHDF